MLEKEPKKALDTQSTSGNLKASQTQKQPSKTADNDRLSRADLKVLKDMNEDYCHVYIGGKHVVISRSHSQVDELSFTFESIPEFNKRFLHLSRIGKKTRGQAWLTWGGKNHKLNGTGFYPDISKCPENVYNFFTGFRVIAKKGDCSPYLYHAKEIICAGDSNHFDYLIKWLAHLFQRPYEKNSVGILLKSPEGTGKGMLVYPINKILGAHGAQTNGSDAITGRFNGVMVNKLLLFADEVDITQKRTFNKMKAMISEPTLMLERKGLEIEPLPNFCRFIFASNHEQVINAGILERRYFVLAASDKKVGDREYFANLRRWADNGGTEALLHYLLNVDISDFNPYACPQTSALIAEKMANLTPILGFLYQQIFQDEPFGGVSRIGATELVNRFECWCKDREIDISLPTARSSIGKNAPRVGLEVIGNRSDRGFGKVYEIPEREILEEKFAAILGMSKADLPLLF